MATINCESSAKIQAGVQTAAVLKLVLYITPATTSMMLKGMIPGSKYYVGNSNTGAQLGAGTVDSTGTATISGVEYYGDIPVTVRVRKSGYKPYETFGVMTVPSVFTVYVNQEIDSLYGV